MSLITFRYNFKNLRIFFYENLLYLILLFNIFPLFFFIGIPHPKLFLISLAFPFLFLRNFKEFIFTKGDKLSSLMMIFIIYQVFTLISAFFYYDLNYFDNANRFYETIFVSSIYSFSPLIVVYIVKRFDLKKLNQTKNFGSFLYSALGIFILFSIILKFKLDGLEFDFFRARDILSIGVNGEVISSPKGIPEGRFSLSTLYYYFGRSNTIAPFLSLAVLTFLPYFKKLLEGFINKKIVIFSFILLIDLFLILLLRSRAALIAVIIPFIGVELFSFFVIKDFFARNTKRTFLFILSFISVLIFSLNSTRYSLQAYLDDPRFDIFFGIISNIKNISIFGKGIGSSHFLCQTLGMEYLDQYNTTECTLHNYYLTLLHDFGIIGFLIFFFIFFIYIKNIIKAIKIFLISRGIKSIQKNSFPNQILSSIYFIFGSSILLFFDSDLMIIQTSFSILYWSLFAINFYSIDYYIKEFQKENYL